MTKKDYIAIAGLFKRQTEGGPFTNPADPQTIENLACGLCQIFETDNPRFDRDRFLAACGV